MLMTSLLICVNIHFFWSFDRVSESFEPGGPRIVACTFTQNEHRQSVFFQMIVWPALDKAVAELLPIGSLVVCDVAMIAFVCRGRHRGTAAYRRWRQRYTLEPLGVEQLVFTEQDSSAAAADVHDHDVRSASASDADNEDRLDKTIPLRAARGVEQLVFSCRTRFFRCC